MNRREFIIASAAVPALSRVVAALPRPQEKPKKSLILGMIKAGGSVEEKFDIAKKAGFDGIEVKPTFDPDEQAKLKAASEKVGLPIHSIIYGGWGNNLLSQPDADKRQQAVENLKKGLQCAHAVGATNLLLVPAVVDAKTRYVEAYERSVEGIKKVIPTAEELKVVVSVEEVWNNFLLSPLEFARFIDDFQSPWVKAYFDVGNIVKNGWPEDWIRTLGKRINRVHLKDFQKKTGKFVKLFEGDVNWKEVRKAFQEAGFAGYMTAEFNGDDYLEPEELSKRIGRIIDGE
jgi:L-ribulose-5-phosphate 3-epimerase